MSVSDRVAGFGEAGGAATVADAIAVVDGPAVDRAAARTAANRLSSDAGLKYHCEIVTESGHLSASSSRSRSESAIHNLNARRSEIGTVSFGRRRGSALKHDSTLTDKLATNLRRSSTSHEGSMLSIQNAAFLVIFFAAANPPPLCAALPNRTRLLARRRSSFC